MMIALVLGLLLAAAPDDFRAYLDQVRKRVESNWKYPANSDDLQATVRFNLDRAGRVSELKVTKSSGRKTFDESILDAVRAAVTPHPEHRRRGAQRQRPEQTSGPEFPHHARHSTVACRQLAGMPRVPE